MFSQLILAVLGCVVLAVSGVPALGGRPRLAPSPPLHFGRRGAALGLLPPLDSPWLPVTTLLVYPAVPWWAVWYPGA